MQPLAGPAAVKQSRLEAFKAKYPAAWYLLKRSALVGGGFIIGLGCQYLPEAFQPVCEALAKLFRGLPL